MEHFAPNNLRADSVCPLPTYWPIKGRFYGERISTLPPWYVAGALRWPHLRANYRAALRAAEGFHALACDAREGR